MDVTESTCRRTTVQTSRVSSCSLDSMGKKLLGCGWLEKIIWPKGPYSQSYGFSCESENEVAQSCPTLSDPMDCSPPGSSVCGIFQARVLGWGAIAFSNAWKWKVKVRSLSHVRLSATPWTAAYQAPRSVGFSRQEYWGGLPLASLIQFIIVCKLLWINDCITLKIF